MSVNSAVKLAKSRTALSKLRWTRNKTSGFRIIKLGERG